MNNYSLPKPIFNVRIYGILMDNDRILISDEMHNGNRITKFPGGGLQFGEGIIDCLKREFIEELNLEIEIITHFYTVDFFQPSAFDPTQQVISIYYKVKCKNPDQIKVTTKKFDFPNDDDGDQSFRWIAQSELFESEFTLPIDKQVGKMLSEQFQGV